MPAFLFTAMAKTKKAKKKKKKTTAKRAAQKKPNVVSATDVKVAWKTTVKSGGVWYYARIKGGCTRRIGKAAAVRLAQFIDLRPKKPKDIASCSGAKRKRPAKAKTAKKSKKKPKKAGRAMSAKAKKATAAKTGKKETINDILKLTRAEYLASGVQLRKHRSESRLKEAALRDEQKATADMKKRTEDRIEEGEREWRRGGHPSIVRSRVLDRLADVDLLEVAQKYGVLPNMKKVTLMLRRAAGIFTSRNKITDEMLSVLIRKPIQRARDKLSQMGADIWRKSADKFGKMTIEELAALQKYPAGIRIKLLYELQLVIAKTFPTGGKGIPEEPKRPTIGELRQKAKKVTIQELLDLTFDEFLLTGQLQSYTFERLSEIRKKLEVEVKSARRDAEALIEKRTKDLLKKAMKDLSEGMSADFLRDTVLEDLLDDVLDAAQEYGVMMFREELKVLIADVRTKLKGGTPVRESNHSMAGRYESLAYDKLKEVIEDIWYDSADEYGKFTLDELEAWREFPVGIRLKFVDKLRNVLDTKPRRPR